MRAVTLETRVENEDINSGERERKEDGKKQKGQSEIRPSQRASWYIHVCVNHG